MLKIAFLTSWPREPARGTGTAVALSGLANALERAGHRVTFVPMPFRTPWIGLNRIIYNVTLPWRRGMDDHDLVMGTDLDGCLYRARHQQCYAVSLKGVLADELTFERGWTRFLLWLQSRFERLNARRGQAVICTSEYSRSVAVRAYRLNPAKVAVVPEGIDLSTWDLLSDESPEGGDRRPTVLTVARAYPRKNVRTLLAAAPAVRKAIPRVRFCVVGGGPELPSLKRQLDRLGLHGTVELVGEVPDSASVRRAFARADVFCLPSRQEGFGIVFLEAMAAGLPIIASRAAAIPEVVPHGKAGILVDPQDRHALAAALIELLTDEELRARLAACGRRHVRQFDWTHVARTLLQVVGMANRA